MTNRAGSHYGVAHPHLAPASPQIYIQLYIWLGHASFALVADPSESPGHWATVVWEGDSREVLQSFPHEARQNLGFQLWQLQQGERPRDSRPLPSIGAGVFERRDQDARAWYRVVYLSRTADVIYVLHCFEKKSRAMPKTDFDLARRRLKAVKARWAEEKRK